MGDPAKVTPGGRAPTLSLPLFLQILLILNTYYCTRFAFSLAECKDITFAPSTPPSSIQSDPKLTSLGVSPLDREYFALSSCILATLLAMSDPGTSNGA